MSAPTIIWRGADELRPLLKPVSMFRPDPNNSRLHDKRSVESIAASLLRFGQQKNIVARADGNCGAGSGTLMAAMLIGWTHLAISVSSNLNEDEMVTYGIADNRTAEFATWDLPTVRTQMPTVEATLSAEELSKMFVLDYGTFRHLEVVEESTAPRLGAIEFRVVIDCADESDQLALLERLRSEGRSCRALMS